MNRFEEFTGFDWDAGNQLKNEIKHKVHWTECEELFFNEPLIILDDPKHSISETRFAAFGRTNDNRLLVVIFTKRSNLIRVISARNMNKKEKKFYENF